MVAVGPRVGLGAEGQPEVGEGRKLCPGFNSVQEKERKNDEWIV